MAYLNCWIAISAQGLEEYKDRRDNPDTYSGPMTSKTYKTLDRMADGRRVQGMFETPTVGGKTYTLFSLYLRGGAAVADAVDDLTDKWPTHFIVVGAWHMDGRQVGTQWELDQDGVPTGNVTGNPLYPVHNQAWRFMPPIRVYDENGDLVSSTPATSNADLRDINVLQGQASRRFT